MQRWSRRTREKVARWVSTAVLVAAAIVLGHGRWSDALRPGRNDPFPAKISGTGRLIDGDSLYVGSDEVRLKGIDAPEGRQTCQRDGANWNCGNEARETLKRLVAGAIIQCDVSERDQHGRLLAYCKAAGKDLNAGMVASGMAVAYGGGYSKEEAEARAAKRGLWGSEFQRPRDWRDAHGVGRTN